MNILLIGEYSRLHNSLKEGLLKLGHHAVIFGFKDGFKDYPVDFAVYKRWDSGFCKKIKVVVFRLTGFDISSYLTYRQFLKYKNQLKGFDVVQLINENSLECQPNFERKILQFIFENNAKTFLLSCGDDYLNVQHAFANPELKSSVQPYLAGKISKPNFENVLKYQRPEFKKLHDFIYTNVAGVIASDLDYEPALKNHPKYLGLIPNPINVDLIPFQPLVISKKVMIFLGINKYNYFKKGSDYFEQALQIVSEKYTEDVEITVVRSVPYAQYMALYDGAHILLDQAFAIDQGYNALEAMAKGKVVFTGAEPEFVARYQLTEKVNLNAVPNVEVLVAELSHLIENPSEIVAIGQRARDFIAREHHYVAIAQKYADTWK